jgi:hypothetical protein
MSRTVLWFIVVVCVILVLGFYMKWINVSGSNTDSKTSDIHFSLNKDKVQEDAKTVKESAQHGADKVKDEYRSLLGEKTIAGSIQTIEMAKQELTIVDDQKKDLMVKVDAATKITIDDKAGVFADLKAEDLVSVKYTANKDGNVATSVTVSKKS